MAPLNNNENGDAQRPLMRNPILLSRVFFVLLAMALGAFIGEGAGGSPIAFTILGFALSLMFVLFEHATNFVSSKSILFAASGAFLGLIFSSLVHPVIPAFELGAMGGRINAVPLVMHLMFCYLGVALALRHAHRFSFSRLNFILSQPSEPEKVLDSSVLIDGRILDIIDTNFLNGPFLVPAFVLRELQRLADSSQAMKRSRGRRALETLETLRSRYGRVRIEENDYAGKSVDAKLITLSRELNATLMTTDYNLQKVAQIHQVRTLNLNELANTLKPSAYVGEELVLHIDRQGKEPGQGVGYLDDGTMMVVEGASECVDLEVVVEVTSVLQNPSGRMIFARRVRDAEFQSSGNIAIPPSAHAHAPQHEGPVLVNLSRGMDEPPGPAPSGRDSAEPAANAEPAESEALIEPPAASPSNGEAHRGPRPPVAVPPGRPQQQPGPPPPNRPGRRRVGGQGPGRKGG